MTPRRLLWLALYALAMAYVEAAVVVDLRALYYPNGFAFPLAPMPPAMTLVEVGREAATLVMLLAVAAVAAPDAWRRFLLFAFLFGVWDIFYYVWLLALVRWPASLLDRDVLFLIPVPWIAPVLAPLLVSACLVAGSLATLHLERSGEAVRFPPGVWAAAVLGGMLVLMSFTLDFQGAMAAAGRPPFHWGLFVSGVGVGGAAVAVALGWHWVKMESEPRI